MRCPRCEADLQEGAIGKFCYSCGWSEESPKSWLEKEKEITDEEKMAKVIKSVLNEEPWSSEAVEMFMRHAPGRPVPEALKAKLLDKLIDALRKKWIWRRNEEAQRSVI